MNTTDRVKDSFASVAVAGRDDALIAELGGLQNRLDMALSSTEPREASEIAISALRDAIAALRAATKPQGYVLVPLVLPNEVKAAMFMHGYTPPNPRSTWEFILSQLGVAYTEPIRPLLAPPASEAPAAKGETK